VELYGGEEHLLKVPPKPMRVGQSEVYHEYAADGTLIKGPELDAVKVVPKSKYLEDVYPNNHTSVWGSYFEAGRWGFACCHQLHKQSFCFGFIPALAAKEPGVELISGQDSNVEPDSKQKAKKHKSGSHSPSPDRGKKRKYNSFEADNAAPVTEADLDNYKRARVHWDDPMAKQGVSENAEINI